MFENLKDGYDSLRMKIKSGLDRRVEKGRYLVELAWVSGETAIEGLKEGTSTSIHKVSLFKTGLGLLGCSIVGQRKILWREKM
jgi:hypothetical protein